MKKKITVKSNDSLEEKKMTRFLTKQRSLSNCMETQIIPQKVNS